MNLEGRMLGSRYEIIEKIGNGGMATVYKARCHVLNRFVAVKVLKDEFTTDEEFIKRFAGEAQAAASLTHPNIVSIYDVGNEGNLYYIVMELVQGRTLKQIIAESGVLPWKWSLDIAIQVASALEAAHKNGIVHRDIKPHNIIITEDGIAKVTDFGIAKAVSNSTITAFGTTIGSVHYFSPEHARGGYTDAKSDIYSLGVVMYEMVTGRVPFDADTPVSIALKHMQEKPVEPIKLNPAIPLSVNKIIMKAMEKDTNLRYQSATEMLRDLSLAVKNPEGDFVTTKSIENDFPTQKIPTMYDRSEEEAQKENKKEKKKGKFKKYLAEHKAFRICFIIFILIAIFVASILITTGILNATRPKEVQIPNLFNMTQEEAQKTLKDLKLQYKVKSEEYNTEVEAGKIISQNPPYKENYPVLEKSTVEVVVSKGTEKTKMPKVTGLTREEAEQAIQDAKLTPQVEEEKSQKIEEGIVIKQEIKEDTELDAGTVVKIYVSIGTGIKQVTVPSVVGKTQEEAEKMIKSAGLTVSTVLTEEDTTKTNGIVLRQSIDANKTVDEGTGITITVNKWQEKKNATVYVNVKSITGGYTTTTNTTDTKKTVKLRVEANGETIYNNEVDKNSTKVNTGDGKIVGVGRITVKVFIDDVKEREADIDLNTTTSYTFD